MILFYSVSLCKPPILGRVLVSTSPILGTCISGGNRYLAYYFQLINYIRKQLSIYLKLLIFNIFIYYIIYIYIYILLLLLLLFFFSYYYLI